MCSGFDFEIAVCDIHEGEQLTDDYGTLNLREPFACACGEPKCREFVRPDDVERWHHIWDEKVRAVFPLIPDVDQPLWPYLRERADVESAIERPEMIRSSLMYYVPARTA